MARETSNLPLERILFTDNRILHELTTYHRQELIPKNKSAAATGEQIIQLLIGLHDAKPRRFEVTLFFKDSGHALDIVEAIRDRWEVLQRTSCQLPETILIIAPNYVEDTPRHEFDLKPSQEDV
jgi:hypothetical protein